jgi:hypothetical protein
MWCWPPGIRTVKTMTGVARAGGTLKPAKDVGDTMGKSQRAKGVRNELETARQLTGATGHSFNRESMREAREGNVGDVMSYSCPLGPVQVKSGKNPPWRLTIDQAKEAGRRQYRHGHPAPLPLGRVKIDYQGSWAVMGWEDFLRICRAMTQCGGWGRL